MGSRGKEDQALINTARPVRHVNPTSSPAVSIWRTILSSVVSTYAFVGVALGVSTCDIASSFSVDIIFLIVIIEVLEVEKVI